MYKVLIKTILPLAVTTCLLGCGQQGANQTASNDSAGQLSSAGNGPDDCDNRGIKVGDKDIQLGLAGTDWRWNTAGSFVTLTEQGNGKDIELVQSTNPGGPSVPKGACLKSNGYIRLASLRHAEPNRYLQALRDDGVDPDKHPDPDHVTIGNYPDPDHIDSIFVVIKAAGVADNSPGDIIRRGDTLIIRGVSHDPWLVAPATPKEGDPVGLVDSTHQDQAAKWVIKRKGPGED